MVYCSGYSGLCWHTEESPTGAVGYHVHIRLPTYGLEPCLICVSMFKNRSAALYVSNALCFPSYQYHNEPFDQCASLRPDAHTCAREPYTTWCGNVAQGALPEQRNRTTRGVCVCLYICVCERELSTYWNHLTWWVYLQHGHSDDLCLDVNFSQSINNGHRHNLNLSG